MAKFSLKFKQEVAEKYPEDKLSLKSVAKMCDISPCTVLSLGQGPPTVPPAMQPERLAEEPEALSLSYEVTFRSPPPQRHCQRKYPDSVEFGKTPIKESCIVLSKCLGIGYK